MTIDNEFLANSRKQAPAQPAKRSEFDEQGSIECEGPSVFRFDGVAPQRTGLNVTPLDTPACFEEEVCPDWRERLAMKRASTPMPNMDQFPLSSASDCVVLLNNVLQCLDEVLPAQSPDDADRYALAATYLQQVIDLLD